MIAHQKLAIVLSIFTLLATYECTASAVINDWTIVPGKRVGPITATTSEADLILWFGRKNVKHQEHLPYGDEGYDSPGAIVFPQYPEKRVYVFWGYSTNRINPSQVEVKNTNKSIWHFSNNITIGTTLSKLVKLNHHPLTFWGFSSIGSGCDKMNNPGQLKKYFKQNSSNSSSGICIKPQWNTISFKEKKVIMNTDFKSNNPFIDPTKFKVSFIIEEFL